MWLSVPLGVQKLRECPQIVTSITAIDNMAVTLGDASEQYN